MGRFNSALISENIFCISIAGIYIGLLFSTQMLSCFRCGRRVVRVHRTFREKLIYSSLFECKQCGIRQSNLRAPVFSRHPRCPSCGTQRLKKRSTVDKIDKFHRTVLTPLLTLTGAKLYHCVFCRLQFYDNRSLPGPAHPVRVGSPVSGIGGTAGDAKVEPA